MAEKVGRAAVGEGQVGADFERGLLPALKNCSGSLEKKALPVTATAAEAAAAESQPGPRDPAAGTPAARCWVHRLAVAVAGWCRSSLVGRRFERVSEMAGSGMGAPGGCGNERWWSKCGLCGERRAGAAG